ncbi:MAG: YggS family pyridoxal phosphate-dependent enzyme [Oscillospiraceae bacterium]|nr:YggS family pyridoxal phosphate-dependent enzyme [Oscillospiraceae bacterium]
MMENHCCEQAARRVETIRKNIDKTAVEAQRDPAEVRLMAVTKTRTAEEVNEVIAAGIDLLGENRAQELCARYEQYDLDRCEIHFIGRLQTNKVRQIIDKVTMIESVDSERLAQEISRQCRKHGIEMDILLEVNIGEEESKGGFPQNELEEAARRIAQLPGLHIKGLMAIPPIEDEEEKARAYFAATKRIFIDIKHKNIDNVSMEILSMGMSGDYSQAILEGSTQVRIGTALFGPRNYPAAQL